MAGFPSLESAALLHSFRQLQMASCIWPRPRLQPPNEEKYETGRLGYSRLRELFCSLLFFALVIIYYIYILDGPGCKIIMIAKFKHFSINTGKIIGVL